MAAAGRLAHDKHGRKNRITKRASQEIHRKYFNEVAMILLSSAVSLREARFFFFLEREVPGLAIATGVGWRRLCGRF